MNTMLTPNRLIRGGEWSGLKVSIQGSDETEGEIVKPGNLQKAPFRKTATLSWEFPGVTLKTIDR